MSHPSPMSIRPGTRALAALALALALALAGVALFSPQVARAAEEPQVVALLVGCDAPRDSQSRLASPSRDIETMESTVRDKLYLHDASKDPTGNRYSRLLNSTATLESVRAWLRTVLPRLAPDDFVMIYFSGFGAIEEVEKGDALYSGADRHEKYLVLHDTDPARLATTALSLSEVQQEIARSPCRNILVALDCSFAAEAEDESLGLGRSLLSPKTRILSDVPEEERREALKALLRGRDMRLYASLNGFGQLDGKSCQVLLAACQDQAAMEYDRLNGEGQGLFTYFLSKGIGGAADSDEDGDVAIKELDRYMKREVARIANVAYGLPQDVQILGRQAMTYAIPLVRLRRTSEEGK